MVTFPPGKGVEDLKPLGIAYLNDPVPGFWATSAGIPQFVVLRGTKEEMEKAKDLGVIKEYDGILENKS